MDLRNNLPEIRRHFNVSSASSFHVSIASVNPDGSPWVTPIGSFLLKKNGIGIYFEMFPTTMPNNFKQNNQVVVMGVNSGFWFWLSSVFRGKFKRPPALRLIGKVGELRDPTEEEVKKISRRFDPLKGTKGHKIMWSTIGKIREIHFDHVAEVRIGKMTHS